jgi:predicted short-subunit dehydrogenase-like oxidoreductase (DUF2520 family)
MTSIKTILAVAASLAFSISAQAESLAPAAGKSFHAGSQHAAVYFLTEDHGCKLILTVADDANYKPSRVETMIASGKSAQHVLSAGKSLSFACQSDGLAMDVSTLETTAAN